MYNFKYNDILGIDLKQDSIHAVHLVKKMAGLRIQNSAWARLPETETEQLKVIEAFIKANKWNKIPCIVSAYHSFSLLRTIEIQDSSPKAVAFGLEQLEKGFSLISPELKMIDYQVVTNSKRKLLTAIAGRTANINSFISFLAQLNIEVVDIVHPAIGMISALETIQQNKNIVLSVNTALFGTDIIMGKNSCPLYFYHSSISSSGYSRENIENPVEDSTVVYPKQLSLIETGRFSKSGLNTIWQSEVSASISKAIIFASKHDITLDKISLALENPASTFSASLAEKTDMQVEDIDTGQFNIPKKFLSAFGLALLGISEKQHMSLLPENMRQKNILKLQRNALFIVPLLILVAEIAVIYMLNTGVASLDQRQSNLKKQLNQEEKIVKDISKLRQENIMYGIQSKPFRNAIVNNRTLLKVLEAISKSKAADDWVTVIADKNRYASDSTSTDSSKTEKKSHKFSSFIVEGYTIKDDLSSVKDMIAKLKECDYIYNADLIGDNVRRDYTPMNFWTNSNYKLFAVELELRENEF